MVIRFGLLSEPFDPHKYMGADSDEGFPHTVVDGEYVLQRRSEKTDGPILCDDLQR